MPLAAAGPAAWDAFQTAKRPHVADQVFDQLASAILRRELPAGAALPAERVLADRFGTSRIIVRQAIHRLCDVGLVRVRQGGATLVLDPDDAGDLGVLELVYRLAPLAGKAPIEPRDVIEKQFLQGLSLVDVARRRASSDDLHRIAELAASFAASSPDERAYAGFEERFWRAVARAGRNRVFVMEVAWWYRVLREHLRAEDLAPSPLQTRVAFYVELSRRLAEGRDPVKYYLDAVGPVLASLAPPDASKPPRASRRRARAPARHSGAATRSPRRHGSKASASRRAPPSKRSPS